jgi:arylsulfatase
MQDLYPTILDLAVVNYDHSSIDGLSLAPTLLEMGEQKIHDYLYWEFPETGGQRALRWGNWKAYNKDLKSTGDTTIYLYNLATDMQEQHDIANEYPEKIDFVKSIFKKEHISSDNPRWKYPVIDEQ